MRQQGALLAVGTAACTTSAADMVGYAPSATILRSHARQSTSTACGAARKISPSRIRRCTSESPVQEKVLGLRGDGGRPQQRDVRDRQHDVIGQAGDFRLRDRDRAVVRLREGTEQTADAERYAAGDAADLDAGAPRRESAARVHVGETAADQPSPAGPTREPRGRAAALERRAQAHDAADARRQSALEHRADQDAAQAMADEVHGVAGHGVDEARRARPRSQPASLVTDG